MISTPELRTPIPYSTRTFILFDDMDCSLRYATLRSQATVPLLCLHEKGYSPDEYIVKQVDISECFLWGRLARLFLWGFLVRGFGFAGLSGLGGEGWRG